MLEFFTGLIDVLEKRIFDKSDQERMLKAPDLKSAFLVLFDTDLGEIISEKREISTQQLIQEDMKRMKEIFIKILKENKKLLYFLFLKFDALNLKIALKNEILFQGEERIPPLKYSLISYSKIVQNLKIFPKKIHSFQTTNPFFDKLFEKTVREVKKNPKEKITSKIIEEETDLAYFETKLELAKKISPFLFQFVKKEIDISNIKKMIFRQEKDKVKLIPNGNLTFQEIDALLRSQQRSVFQDVDKFLEIYELSLILNRFSKHNSKKILEYELNNFLTQIIFSKEKEIGMGVEKILSFFYKKINALLNIKLILFAKKYNLNIEKIEGLLLNLY